MNKTIIIGDIHGEKHWQKIQNEIDKCRYMIFMGDYVDSFERSDKEISKNLEKVIDLKKNNKEKVILLLGNHDNQYLFGDLTRCSGFRPQMFTVLKNKFEENIDLFCVSHQIEDVLFTHGGLLNDHFRDLNRIFKKEKNMRYDTYLNMFFRNKIIPMLSVSYIRGGSDRNSGIFWTDWRELLMEKEMLPVHQVVGHSANFGGSFSVRKNGKFIFNSDNVHNRKFYEMFKNANDNWIFKERDF